MNKLKPYDPERGKHDPARGYQPSAKRYDLNDQHFEPLHLRERTPRELLEKERGETFEKESAT